MQITNDEAMSLVRRGAEALQQGRAAEARGHLQRVTATGRANAQIWLLLATACRADNDPVGEEAAIDGLRGLDERDVRANIMKGDCRARAGDHRGSLGFYEAALLVAQSQPVPDSLVPEVRRAEAAVAEWRERLDAEREAALIARGFPVAGRSPRFQQALDILAGRKRIYVQEPTGYYFPGLPNIQYFDTAQFDWAPGIEAATGAILEELNGLLAGMRGDFRPYLKADPNHARIDQNHLLDSPDWSVLFLCENGRNEEAVIARCPRTWAAVQTAPMPQFANSPTAMFSLLRAGARIPPHTGMFNTRLVCHLPLIVPPGCRFRVGNEVREWEVGKLLVFDDTIEHEAWNDSGEDRVVLIFDIWRPELSEQERLEFAALASGPLLE
ncbi:aspartyl/asparaginyl beta-hydroxylase domain-containing protein [Sphingomonas sp. LB-2]|uniref:aspartyl/asparaginyl beta-hydroxylase domain-containing protein n=1 Tax=Sphingomonas caeni TaxID=2984949 RepID=UPI00222EEE7E|nr:aspartyl/asparaginyl beta-hydroxylase domain-containing protein [Sphingomonas caeni]MCW3846619.1 aspartyl/asparaginyl beta-hydroxylase domain-containing protein [Sphingomonas caeni]